jgi:RNA polymerase sporulation-specific sigma factor
MLVGLGIGSFITLLSLWKLTPILVSYMQNEVFPEPLSPEEEAYYLNVLQDNRNNKDQASTEASILVFEEAHCKLIEHNLRLVAYTVKRYEHSKSGDEDLFSIGIVGLIKAVNSFKLEKGVKLSTYAIRCIENEIRMELRRQKRELSNVSLYKPIGIDKDGNEMTLMDVLICEDNELNNVENRSLCEKILKKVKDLPERDRKIFILRYGAHDGIPKTQLEVGSILGITRSYVSRIEQRLRESLLKEL